VAAYICSTASAEKFLYSAIKSSTIMG